MSEGGSGAGSRNEIDLKIFALESPVLQHRYGAHVDRGAAQSTVHHHTGHNMSEHTALEISDSI